jgi:hypothetical protein
VKAKSTDRAVVVQRVARLPFLAGGGGASPTPRLHLTPATVQEVNQLLSVEHYLGPAKSARHCFAGWADDELVAAQVWRWPTARMLPSDGSWLELSRWCLTPQAGKNAGSRMMGFVAKWLRRNCPEVTTLVSYSDPVHGHTGSLYKASGWTYTPTHHSERYDANGKGYPSGHGSWDGVTRQSPKHRWTYRLKAAT